MSKAKSERLKIREMELEHELLMQREKLLADAFLHPPGIYLVGLGGSVVAAYFAALITPPGSRDADMDKLVANGILAAIAGPVGVGAAAGSKWTMDQFTGGANPLGTLFGMAGAGGASLFTALLILNEMKPDGGESAGTGVLGTLLAAI
jgi:hypothetical protein